MLRIKNISVGNVLTPWNRLKPVIKSQEKENKLIQITVKLAVEHLKNLAVARKSLKSKINVEIEAT